MYEEDKNMHSDVRCNFMGYEAFRVFEIRMLCNAYNKARYPSAFVHSQYEIIVIFDAPTGYHYRGLYNLLVWMGYRLRGTTSWEFITTVAQEYLGAFLGLDHRVREVRLFCCKSQFYG